jgi:N utilization substance protein B
MREGIFLFIFHFPFSIFHYLCTMLSRRLLRIKVVKALYAHFKSESDSVAATVKALKTGIDSTYNLYLQMLRLIVDVADYAEGRIELGRQKKLPTHADLHPNTRFVENEAVRAIAASEELKGALKTRKLGWATCPEVVKALYNLMAESEYYKKYMAADASSWHADVQVVDDFYTLTAQDNDMLEEAVEEGNIMWADDLDFALSMVVRTLAGMREGRPLRLLPQFGSDDDERFGPELLRATLEHYDTSVATVAGLTENWDMDRVAFTDTLIMATAIAELQGFPTIPVKVTLDEYIEIAKHYSTQGSGTFVNGILDKVVKELKIEKSGRGLL